MKRLLAGIACLALCVGAFAQGTVVFSNAASALGTAQPVFDADGTTKLDGPTYVAQLWAGPAESSIAPWGDPVPFRPAGGAGIWNPGSDSTRIIGNVAPGEEATVVVRAWEAAGGTIYAAAVAGGFKYGESTSIRVATGGLSVGGNPPSFPAALTGFTSFSLVPEPSTYALLALGAAALFLRRRK